MHAYWHYRSLIGTRVLGTAVADSFETNNGNEALDNQANNAVATVGTNEGVATNVATNENDSAGEEGQVDDDDDVSSLSSFEYSTDDEADEEFVPPGAAPRPAANNNQIVEQPGIRDRENRIASLVTIRAAIRTSCLDAYNHHGSSGFFRKLPSPL